MRRTRWMAWLLAACMMILETAPVAAAPISDQAVNRTASVSGNILHSGISKDLSWEIDDKGCLKISGTGDYDSSQDFWQIYSDEITSAVVTDVTGITSTAGMFAGLSKLTTVDLTGLDTTAVTDMSNMFRDCFSLTALDLNNFQTFMVADMHDMFKGCNNVKTLDVSQFDTTNVTDMSGMFENCSSLTTLEVGGFDTTEVTNMASMFLGCISLTSLDVSNFCTDNVTNMTSMFSQCKALTELHVENFNMYPVREMNYMFESCSSLKSLDLCDWLLDDLYVDKSSMLMGCDSLKYLIVPDHVAGEINLPSHGYAWVNNNRVKVIQVEEGLLEAAYYFNLSQADEEPDMLDLRFVESELTIYKREKRTLNLLIVPGFAKDTSLTWTSSDNNVATVDNNGKLTAVELGTTLITVESANGLQSSCMVEVKEPKIKAQDLSKDLQWILYDDGYLIITGEGDDNVVGTWCQYSSDIKRAEVNIKNITNPAFFFQGCNYLEEVDFSGSDTSQSKYMGNMFYDCRRLKSLDLSGWDTSNAVDMSGMFSGCTNLQYINFGQWNTGKVKYMSEMFSRCSKLEQLDIADWDTSSLTSMTNIFSECSSLKKLDLSQWNTEHITAMSFMFNECSSLEQVNITGFKTANVWDMNAMFNGCINLKTLDVSGFNTSNVTNMMYMFSGCSSLYNLDLDSWDTSNVTDMSYMFSGCKSLKELNISGFKTAKLVQAPAMFSDCRSLEGLDLSGWDFSHMENMYVWLECCYGLKYIKVPAYVPVAIALPESKIDENTPTPYEWIDENKTVCTQILINDTRPKIYVKVENGKSYVPFAVTLSKNKLYLKKGEEEKLTAEIAPVYAIDKTLTWESSDTTVATVDDKGLVKMLEPGKATITVTTVNGLKASCEVAEPVAITEMKLSETELRLRVTGEGGEIDRKRLNVEILPANTTESTLVKWTSSDSTIAKVDAYGNVTAGWQTGTAVITATLPNEMAVTCNVRVDIYPENLYLSAPGFFIEKVGDSVTINPSFVPENTTATELTWTSADTSVATVNDGIVTAVGKGITEITAETINGIQAKSKIYVGDNLMYPTSIELSENHLHFHVGESATITAKVYPEEALDKTVIWESNDYTVATVSSTGTVTAVGEGRAMIIAHTGSEVSAICMVTVGDDYIEIEPTGISFPETKLTKQPDDFFSLTPVILPADATNQTVTWTSSDETVVMIDSPGWFVVKAEGTAVITATTWNGHSATCEVTVLEKPAEIIEPTGIEIDVMDLAMQLGERVHLTATIVPDHATDKTIYWYSNNSGVATVDNDGNVNAVGEGIAHITASTPNGCSVSCTVTVTTPFVPLAGITLLQNKLTLDVEESSNLIVNFFPANASNQSIVWTSSDSGVATVDDWGHVTAIGGGTAMITAIAYNGMTAICVVQVNEPATPNNPDDKDDPNDTDHVEDPDDKDDAENSDDTDDTVNSDDEEDSEEPDEPEEIKVRKISITGMSKKVAAGKKITLTAKVTPQNADNTKVTWSTSNKKYATVSSKGVVTTKKAGAGKSVTITATAKDGSKVKAKYKISIMKNAVKSISFTAKTKAVKTIKVGKKLTLKTTVKTTGSKVNKVLKWSSSHTKYATISSKGVVKANKAGKGKKVKFTAMATDGTGKKATITIKIK